MRAIEMIAVTLGALVCLATTAHAQETKEDFLKSKFAGWGGIVFVCVPDEAEVEILEGICQSAMSKARFLAAASRIPFEGLGVISDGYDLGFREGFAVAVMQPRGLVLEVEVHATKPAVAMSVTVKALSSYSEAVELGEKTGPQSSPKSGELGLWERVAIGSGAGYQFQQAMSDALDQLLQNFFSDYLIGQQ